MPRARGGPAAAFRLHSLVALAAFNLIGGLLIAVGFGVARQQDSPGSQNGWINLCVGGLILSGAANSAWISLARRQMRLAREAVIGDVADRATRTVRALPAEPDSYAAVSGGNRFHDPVCALVRSKQTLVGRRDQHVAAGRTPCEVCQP